MLDGFELAGGQANLDVRFFVVFLAWFWNFCKVGVYGSYLFAILLKLAHGWSRLVLCSVGWHRKGGAWSG